MMPIIINKNDVEWSQTSGSVLVKVHLKGVKSMKTVVTTSPDYIRVYFAPFIFEAFLWGEVDDENGKCTIEEPENRILFEMDKVEKDLEWPSLEKSLSREEKKALRDSAVDVTQKRHEERRKALTSKRQEQKQMVVRDQIRLDGEERERISAIKKAEAEKALEELQEWREERNSEETYNALMTRTLESQTDVRYIPRNPTVSSSLLSSQVGARRENGLENILLAPQNHSTGDTVIPSSAPLSTPGLSGGTADKVNPASSQVPSSLPRHPRSLSYREAGNNLSDTHPEAGPPSSPSNNSTEKTSLRLCLDEDNLGSGDRLRSASKEIWESKETEIGNALSSGSSSNSNSYPPHRRPVRDPGRITVTFTPREFPTPSRESTAVQEQEWLKKQAEARRRCGFDDADLRPEEKDPMWLLEKGRSLMQVGSYLGAVSAFTHGIKLAPKLPELYLGRAQAQVALKNLVKTVEDASQALELFTPKVDANAEDRCKCHAVRATSFRLLKCYKEALMDYKEAVKLDPNDSKLGEELEICESILYKKAQGGGGSDSDSD